MTALQAIIAPGGILLIVVGAIVLFCFDPSQHPFYPVCVFHKTTGLLCPGCGSLRALHQLLHGHWAAALRFNALLISSLPVAAWLFGRFAARKLKDPAATLVIRPLWFWCAVMIAFGILRNMPFAQLAWLAP